jgi:serine/threonine-protein kinase
VEIDVGQIVGNKYVLVRLLGAGAMGQVWVARHQALQQTFAVKLMVPPSSNAAYEGVETSLRRFQNEAQIAAALSRKSRHIAAVTDYGIDDGTAYLVMELLEGEGLDRRVGDGNRLHPEEVSNVIAQIAKGLTVAHAEGVTHRDLKPANVFFTKTEEGDLLVKILDFGIAQMARRIVKPKDGSDKAPTRLTIKGLVLGSPAYMSPEQAMAESPDYRADVWSLAVVAFEALAGVGPFHANDADETILRICNFRATPLRKVMPDASEELEGVFLRAFSSRIEERFQTATAFASALAAVLPTPARKLAEAPPPIATQPMEIESGMSLKVPVRPRKLVPAILAGAGVGLVVAAIFFVPRFLHERSTPEANHAAESASVAKASPPSLSSSAAIAAPPPQTATAATSTTSAPNVSVTATAHKIVTPPNTISTTTAATPAPSKSVDRSAVF